MLFPILVDKSIVSVITNELKNVIGELRVTIKQNGERIFKPNVVVFKLRLHLIHPLNEHIFIAAKGGMVTPNL
jgi:hypothetical protein